MLHVNQVPSLCDFSRCLLRWWSCVKRSEQCLHEYGFAPVWIRTWRFRSLYVLKQLPTVRTVIQSSVAVYTSLQSAVYYTFVSLQVAGDAETSVTEWTLVWFISHVESHVIAQMWRPSKCFLKHVTFVRFLSTVNSTVHNKLMWCCKLLAINSTFKWFHSWMTSSVYW